jgi:anaerobic magnesium-protoporphyrin IX monomethyl ester cyclase
LRVLFIEIDTESSWSVASIGPAFMASYLREHGHEVSFIRVPADTGDADFVRQVCEASPDLIGVSLTTRQWQRARALFSVLRGQLDRPVIAGGLHPTFSPKAVLEAPGFDYVCLGEGEAPMLDLVRALESGQTPDGIANIWVEGGGRPALRPPFEPIDALPFMARDLLDEHPGVVHMTTQRGCPFPCTYCAARMYNQLYQEEAPDHEYGRRRSVRSVLDELHALHDAGRLHYVIFLDDTFTINRSWVREFCQAYGAELGLPFSLHARVETVTRELLQMLGKAGCSQITYGVESGSERVRRQVMQRMVKNERFVEVFRWTREANITVTANYMLGLPGETPEDLQQTLALARELDVLDFGYFVFYPYPGTQLFRECRDKGYLPEDYAEREANHRETILDLPTLSAADISEAYDGFTRLREEIYQARAAEDATPVQIQGAIDHVQVRASTG